MNQNEDVSNTKKALQTLRSRGVFRAKDAVKLGIPRTTLARLTEEGELNRLGRGLYIHPNSPIDDAERDFALACARFGPRSVIGGPTALFHYGLIEQVPVQIWLLVPTQKNTTSRQYRIIRTGLSSKVGVNDNGSYRITTVERTIAEAFRYASKIGLRTAVHAARKALSQGLTTEQKVFEVAKKLKIENHILKVWEAVIA